MKRMILLPTLLLALFAVPCVEAQKPAEHTNRREVMQNEDLRGDFVLQGEYLATLPDGKLADLHLITDGKPAGLHLIADGDGKFRFVQYAGGLPGDGWERGLAHLQRHGNSAQRSDV